FEEVFAVNSSAWLLHLEPLIQEAFRQVQSMIERYQHAFQGQVDRITLIHGDVGSHNLRLTEQGIYMMDWEFATTGDPAYDIGILFRNEDMTIQQRDEFLAVYLESSPASTSRNFLDRLNFYELVAAYQNALWAVRQLLRGAAGQVIDRPTEWFIRFITENLARIDLELSQQATKVLRIEATGTE
ncbi:MAG: phosphotransferase, partial [Anaerolineae bacterium]|nr:phosphotransferase [Anaerolineae bacterium]